MQETTGFSTGWKIKEKKDNIYRKRKEKKEPKGK